MQPLLKRVTAMKKRTWTCSDSSLWSTEAVWRAQCCSIQLLGMQDPGILESCEQPGAIDAFKFRKPKCCFDVLQLPLYAGVAQKTFLYCSECALTAVISDKALGCLLVVYKQRAQGSLPFR